MSHRSISGINVTNGLACALLLQVVGCAHLGDAWQSASRQGQTPFDASSPSSTPEQLHHAKVAYGRALEARASGDSKAAANHLRDAAELGHAHAAYELGLAYIDGNGVPASDDLSAYWINRAADLGDPGAQFLVGASFYGGIGVERDVPLGLSFLERAAAQGHPKAQFLLGQAYVDGVGVPQNAEWAARWYGKAALGGNPEAQYALGVMFATGFGVPESAHRAYQWLSISAANGYQKASNVRDRIAGRLTSISREKADASIAHFSAEMTSGYTDAPTVMYVQLRLLALGYDVGPADGIAGPMTRAAIAAFQSSERLNVDGNLSRELVEILFARTTSRGT